MTQCSPVCCITQTQLTFIIPTTHEQILSCYIENAIIIINFMREMFLSQWHRQLSVKNTSTQKELNLWPNGYYYVLLLKNNAQY